MEDKGVKRWMFAAKSAPHYKYLVGDNNGSEVANDFS